MRLMAFFVCAASLAAGETGHAFSMAEIREQCLGFAKVKQGAGPDEFRECRVSESGDLGIVRGQTCTYALYCLIPNYAQQEGGCAGEGFNAWYYRQRGLAIFTRRGAGDKARLLFERVNPAIGEVVYEKPEIVRNAAGTMLYLPIAVDGTGAGNESEYYLRRGGGWKPVESERWTKELTHRIPAGTLLRRGVWPDLRTMVAEVGLYREGDANCCPTWGRAKIKLAIRQRRFVIESMTAEKGK